MNKNCTTNSNYYDTQERNELVEIAPAHQQNGNKKLVQRRLWSGATARPIRSSLRRTRQVFSEGKGWPLAFVVLYTSRKVWRGGIIANYDGKGLLLCSIIDSMFR